MTEHGYVRTEECSCGTCREMTGRNLSNPLLKEAAEAAQLPRLYSIITNYFVEKNLRERALKVAGFHFQDAVIRNQEYLTRKIGKL